MKPDVQGESVDRELSLDETDDGIDADGYDGIDADRYLLDQTYGNEWWRLDVGD